MNGTGLGLAVPQQRHFSERVSARERGAKTRRGELEARAATGRARAKQNGVKRRDRLPNIDAYVWVRACACYGCARVCVCNRAGDK